MASYQSSGSSTIAWLLVTGIILTTAISFLSRQFGWPYYLERWSHFQLQYWVISAIGLLGIGLTRQRWPFWLGLACTTLLAMQILAWYFPLHFWGTPERSNLSILVANVNTRNQDYADLLTFVDQQNPDLAIFVEVDDAWRQQLSKALSDRPYYSGKDNRYEGGILAFSRYPLRDIELRQFEDSSPPSIVGTVVVNDQPIVFVGTHPAAPLGAENFEARNQQLRQLGQYLQTVEEPKVVLGDLNITMWSPYYRRFVRQTGLENARDGFGLLPSWPTVEYGGLPGWLPLLLSIPIDHCLLSPELAIADIGVGPNVGSDHRPLLVDLKV